MMTLIKKLSLYLILAATIMVVLNYLYGENTIKILHMEHLENTQLYWYRIDTTEYIFNIRSTFQQATKLQLESPPGQWIENPSLQEFFDNNMVLILNYIVLILNIIIMPFRFIFYVIKGLLAFVGVNVMNPQPTDGLNWLVQACNWMIETFRIPYVNI